MYLAVKQVSLVVFMLFLGMGHLLCGGMSAEAHPVPQPNHVSNLASDHMMASDHGAHHGQDHDKSDNGHHDHDHEQCDHCATEYLTSSLKAPLSKQEVSDPANADQQGDDCSYSNHAVFMLVTVLPDPVISVPERRRSQIMAASPVSLKVLLRV